MWLRIWAISQKEFTQTFRDRSTLMLLLVLPLLQLFLFAYAIHMDVKHITMVVADQSLDPKSRSYLDALVQSQYFDIVASVPGEADVVRAIDAGVARVGIVIPPGLAAHMDRGNAQILLLVDGSDSFTTQSAYNTATVISQQFAVNLVLNKLAASASMAKTIVSPLTTHIQVLYNPDMNDLWFIIPGLIAMLLQTQTLALTALAVVREREMGTIEQILVTPIRPTELMLGKTLPNLCIAIVNMLTIMVVGTLVFGVPFQGNFWVFLILSILYAISGLGLGLLISSVSQNQRQASQLTLMIVFLGQILTGFIFPRYAMPAILSTIGYIFPLTYFIPIARGMFTKGIGIEFLWGQVFAIVIFIVIILFFAARLFRQKME
jgi:ABC-2 type transport system permease protein